MENHLSKYIVQSPTEVWKTSNSSSHLDLFMHKLPQFDTVFTAAVKKVEKWINKDYVTFKAERTVSSASACPDHDDDESVPET